MPNLLLVEDDRDLVNELRRALEAADFAVAAARDGAMALAEFDRRRPDVAVLDWRLAGELDGIDVLRGIRRRAPTPVLILTARASLADKLAGFAAGADDYLVKPFAVPELIARLTALQRRAHTAAPDVNRPIDDGGVVVDPGAQRASVDGTAVDLTPGEFALLAVLLRHPERAFHRAHLAARIGRADGAGGRAVDNLVLRLRRKLGRHGARLVTVFGLGYRWARSES